MDQSVLRWFEDAERMDGRIAKRVLMVEVSLKRVQSKQMLDWMDGLKVAFGSRGMTVETTRQYARGRKEWRALVHM